MYTSYADSHKTVSRAAAVDRANRQYEAPAITLVQETQQQQPEAGAQRTGAYRTKTTLARDLRRDAKHNINYETVLVQLPKQINQSFSFKMRIHTTERR